MKYVFNRQNQQTTLEMFAINGSMSSDKSSIAHAFNECVHFPLASKITNVSRDPLSYLKGSLNDSFVLYETIQSI